MASNMQFHVRTADGKEYGPAEQDVLIQWAKSGRITSTCEIRNSLVRKWTPARKIPFLADIVRDEAADNKKTFLPEVPEQKSSGYSLNQRGKFKYVPANTGLRFGAWCMDMVIVGAVVLAIVVAGWRAIDGDSEPMLVWSVVTAASLVCYLGYYILIMGLRAQTVGQWFWGIMVSRSDGKPVLMGRACWFAVMQLCFFWTTLFFVFVLPSKRALQDMLSGIVVTRITVREIAAASL